MKHLDLTKPECFAVLHREVSEEGEQFLSCWVNISREREVWMKRISLNGQSIIFF